MTLGATAAGAVRRTGGLSGWGGGFRFGWVELWAGAGAAWGPELADVARGEWAGRLGPGGWGVGCATLGGGLVPIGEAQGSKLTLGEAEGDGSQPPDGSHAPE